MEFNEFIEKIKSELPRYLPEEYRYYQVKEYKKLNESYTGLWVSKAGQTMAPTLNLDELYTAYITGSESMEEILKYISSVVQMERPHINTEQLHNYEYVKDHLFIRASSVTRNQEMLKDVPHEVILDMAITYHIQVNMGEEGMSSTIINYDALDIFGVSKEQLHADAMANSPLLIPAEVNNMNDVIRQLAGNDLDDLELPPTQMFVVSNEIRLNGAAALFYPGMMEYIGKCMHRDYFVIPSSIHEVLIYPDNGEFQYQELEEMVKQVNASEVSPEDRLADTVYHYDKKAKMFERAAAFDARQKAQDYYSAKAVDRLLEMDFKKPGKRGRGLL